MEITFKYKNGWCIILTGTHYIKDLPPRTNLLIKESEDTGESLYAHNSTYGWFDFPRPVPIKEGQLFKFERKPEND